MAEGPLVYVVDDDLDLTWALERSLSQRGYQVTVVNRPGRALERMRQQPPHAVILDVIMPEMDGFEVCRRLRGDPRLAQIPILFLTAKDEQESVIQGLQHGADDYVTKPFDVRELELRLRALLRRDGLIWAQPPAARITVGEIELDCSTFTVNIHSPTNQREKVPLTPVEFQLLRHLLTHAGQVISTQKLLEEVWDYPPGTGSPNLVRAHVKNLRAKLEEVPSEPRYIQTVFPHGYLLPNEP